MIKDRLFLSLPDTILTVGSLTSKYTDEIMVT